MTPSGRRAGCRIALAAALLGITYLATTPVQYQVVAAVSDKVEHAAAFWVLGLLADFSFPHRGFGPGKILALLAYALAIEALQAQLPYRAAEWQDLAAGAAGLLAYAASIPLLKRWDRLRWRWEWESAPR